MFRRSLAWLLLTCAAVAAVEPGEEIRLWKGDAPGSEGVTAAEVTSPVSPPPACGATDRPPPTRATRARRPDLTNIDTTSPRYMQESLVPTSGETHGGEDVPIYASGPMAYLVHGVLEETVVFHVMAEALGLK